MLSHGLTDQGQVRSQNEDQFAITEVRRVLRVRQSSISQPEVLLGDQLGHLLVVADGMGGHQAGEVASAMAVAGIENLVLNTIGWLFRLRGEGVLNELREALRTTDRWLEEAGGRQPELHGMGTTLTMAYVTGRMPVRGPRRRQPLLPVAARVSSSSSPRTTPWWPGWSATAPSRPSRPPTTACATS